MIELGLALLLLGALGGGAAVIAYVSWYYLFGIGMVLIAGGLLLGVPTGLVYHVQLYRVLRPRGVLAPRWWLHPIRLHPLLPDTDRLRVLAWCWLGAAGWVIAVAGCALLAIGTWRSD